MPPTYSIKNFNANPLATWKATLQDLQLIPSLRIILGWVWEICSIRCSTRCFLPQGQTASWVNTKKHALWWIVSVVSLVGLISITLMRQEFFPERINWGDEGLLWMWTGIIPRDVVPDRIYKEKWEVCLPALRLYLFFDFLKYEQATSQCTNRRYSAAMPSPLWCSIFLEPGAKISLLPQKLLLDSYLVAGTRTKR